MDKKGFSVIALLFIFGALILGGTGVVYFTSKENPPVDSPESAPQNPVPVSTGNEAASTTVSSNPLPATTSPESGTGTSGKKISPLKPANLENLVQGHNDARADRINLVIVGINFSSIDELKNTGIEMLSWGGSPVRNGVAFGPFAIEPLRSNKGKFNVWYDTAIINGTTQDDIRNKAVDEEGSINKTGLKYVVPIFLNKLKQSPGINTFITPHSVGFGITLEDNSFSSLTKDKLQPKAVFVNVQEPLTSPSQLAHELGHGIFGLADEKTDSPFDKPGSAPRIRAPDCVATPADAQKLWGDMVGQVDPFYTNWKSTLQQNGQWETLFPSDVSWWKSMDDGVKVGYYYGQCYGDPNGKDAIRPTDFSIMNQSQVAVFGPVNRKQVEIVLGFFKGF
ncbi:MAG: hypothetical protein HY432_01045 [Candidatus Liptonbacteria bacterium]|nr:hypothetical protein [Candidatus Liptonbacteria bacterium]